MHNAVIVLEVETSYLKLIIFCLLSTPDYMIRVGTCSPPSTVAGNQSIRMQCFKKSILTILFTSISFLTSLMTIQFLWKSSLAKRMTENYKTYSLIKCNSKLVIVASFRNAKQFLRAYQECSFISDPWFSSVSFYYYYYFSLLRKHIAWKMYSSKHVQIFTHS